MEELKEKVKNILAEHGIRMSIFGCGCCGSPEVCFEKNGVLIVKDQECFNIDMFSEQQESLNNS